MWKPVVATADAETALRCWNAIEEIERELLEPASADHSDPSLSTGLAGQALFFAYLNAARQGSGTAALDALGRSIDALSETILPPGLYSGFSGIAWSVEHLTRRFFETKDDLCSAIDAGLGDLLSIPDRQFNPELVTGLSGFGVYLVERLPIPAAAELLGRIIDLLEETVEESEDGLTWRTLPDWMPDQQREVMPGGYYNLGVAHGVPGALGFLAAARRGGCEDPRLPRLADGLVRWLLGCRLQHEGSAFPAHFAPGQPAEPARAAWCYGDPGIAAILISAARSFNRPDWEAVGLPLARHSARLSEQAAGIVDAGLCHGTAGLAHLFNRIHQATGDPELGEAALTWTRRTLDKRRPGADDGGHLSFLPGETKGDGMRKSKPGVLNGSAGIGLALLAAVSNIEPAWDRVLLTAIPPLNLENLEEAAPR
jgi:lantibiotic modifying enzyme